MQKIASAIFFLYDKYIILKLFDFKYDLIKIPSYFILFHVAQYAVHRLFLQVVLLFTVACREKRQLATSVVQMACTVATTTTEQYKTTTNQQQKSYVVVLYIQQQKQLALNLM